MKKVAATQISRATGRNAREGGRDVRPTRMDKPALCDDEAERLGVLADARISRDDGHQLWCFAEQFYRRQMHRIERRDRFDGERAADSGKYRSVNVEDEAAPLEGPQRPNGPLFFCRGQPAGRARPDDCPARLGEGQG